MAFWGPPAIRCKVRLLTGPHMVLPREKSCFPKVRFSLGGILGGKGNFAFEEHVLRYQFGRLQFE